MKYRFAEMIWYEIKEAAEQDRVAVLPVATYEDHGPHLPVDTDVVLCTGICERAVARIPSEAVLVPPVPHGYSPHHMDFHGTLTITHGIPSSDTSRMSAAASRYHGFKRDSGRERPRKQCAAAGPGNPAVGDRIRGQDSVRLGEPLGAPEG